MKHLLAIAIVLSASTAHAHYGACYSNVVQREVAVTYPQTIVQNQNIFYSVGADVRQYAVAPAAIAQAQAGQVERQIAQLQDRLAEYRQQAQPAAQPVQLVYAVPAQAAYCAPSQQPAMQPAQQPLAAMQAKPSGIVEAKCLKCHGGNGAPKGNFDVTKKLDCNETLLAIQKVRSGEMPKNGPALTTEEQNKLIDELLHVQQPAKADSDAENY